MSKETIVRIIILFVVFVNQALVSFGFTALPWEGDQVGEFVSLVMTVIATAWAWWKNNSVSEPAVTADKILYLIKQGSITVAQVKEFIAEQERRRTTQ